ncbi:MAG: hypothetical protein PHV59_09685 [Victivallales bacterium]|nr:hypothetical protein [Victivallales bacterium]
MERSGQNSELDGMTLGLEWAGIIGVEPWSFTLRELYTMMFARQRAEWQRAALLTATVKNLFVSSKAGLVKPESLNPYHRKAKKVEAPPKVSKEFMIEIFKNKYKNKKTGNPC